MQETTRAFLDGLDSLDHGARVAAAARHALSLDEAANFLDDLIDDGEPFTGRLAVTAALAVRDEARLRSLLGHPSVGVRLGAARVCAKGARDIGPLVVAALSCDPGTFRALAGSLVQRARRVVASAFIDALLAAKRPRDAAPLLALADVPQVEAALPKIGDAAAPWRGLARRHPDWTLDRLEAALDDAPAPARASVWWRYQAAMEPLVERRAGRLLALLARRFPPARTPHWLLRSAGRLARRAPDPLVGFLLAPTRRDALERSGLGPALLRHLDALTAEQVAALARGLAGVPERLAELLGALPPSRRGEVFEHAIARRDTAQTLWPDALLAALPHALRHREAERMLALRVVREDPARTLALNAFRAEGAARPVLEAATRGARAEDRAAAWALLVANAGHERRGFDATLDRLARLRNEQDPVRAAAFRRLAALPPSLIEDAHAERLGALVDFAMEARDTSAVTRHALHGLATRLLRLHARRPTAPLTRFALETMVKLTGQAGVIHFPALYPGLPRGAEHAVVEALLPWLKAATKREYHANALRLATALGDRAHAVEPLQALVGEAIWSARTGLASSAATLWLAPRASRDARVRALLDRDPSAILLAPVFEHLHRRRQSWLDPFLDGTPVRGRFATGKVVHVPPAADGFHRWLPRQQHAMAALLRMLADDAGQSSWVRTHAIARLGRLPALTVDALRPYLERPDVTLQEAALGALVWLDRPTGALPLLLEHLDGDRARVAMYALPRLARLISPDRLLDALDTLLGREHLKITVHKEALRLLGAQRSPHALALLQRQWAADGVHRDVRIAGLHAARAQLDAEPAWAALEAAAGLDDPDVALSLLDPLPTSMLAEHRPRYLDVLLCLASHPALRVRKALFGKLSRRHPMLPSWLDGEEERAATPLAAAVVDFDEAAWSEAADALVAVAATRPEPMVEVLETLAERATTESVEPTPARDMPASFRLYGLVGRLELRPAGVRPTLRPVLTRGAAALRGYPLFWTESARLTVAALPREPDAAAARLRGLAEELPSARLLPFVQNGLQRRLGDDLAWETDEVAEVVDALCASPAADARLLALTLLQWAGPRATWPATLRARLANLRRDPDADVRHRARRVATGPC